MNNTRDVAVYKDGEVEYYQIGRQTKTERRSLERFELPTTSKPRQAFARTLYRIMSSSRVPRRRRFWMGTSPHQPRFQKYLSSPLMSRQFDVYFLPSDVQSLATMGGDDIAFYVVAKLPIKMSWARAAAGGGQVCASPSSSPTE